MKKLLMALIFPMCLFLQACDDAGVAAGAGFVAGVIIGSTAPTCHSGYETRCSSYYNHWGYYVRECRDVYHSCARRYSAAMNLDLSGMVSDVEGQKAVSAEVARVATKYQMSFEGASMIVDALDKAKSKDLSGINALGLKKEDLMSLSKGQKVSKDGLKNLSEKLNLSEASAQKMMNKIAWEVRMTQAVR